jgi:hypothetical protein
MAEAAQVYHHDTPTLNVFIRQHSITMSADWTDTNPNMAGESRSNGPATTLKVQPNPSASTFQQLHRNPWLKPALSNNFSEHTGSPKQRWLISRNNLTGIIAIPASAKAKATATSLTQYLRSFERLVDRF